MFPAIQRVVVRAVGSRVKVRCAWKSDAEGVTAHRAKCIHVLIPVMANSGASSRKNVEGSGTVVMAGVPRTSKAGAVSSGCISQPELPDWEKNTPPGVG